MTHLPSKNFIAPIGAALVIIFTGWLALRIWNTPAKNSGELAQSGKNTDFISAYDNAARDTDKDGLKDWEEMLWKTNLSSADTDGDGTPDGEEIKLGRDPLAKGPGDQFKKLEELGKNTESEELKTLTGQLAGEFAVKYFAEKMTRGNMTISETTKANIAGSLVSSIEKAAAAYNGGFEEKDLDISETADSKKYLNELGTLMSKNFKNIKGSELDILSAMLNDENFARAKELEPYLTAYQKTAGTLKKMPVPKSYAALHLEALNIMQNTASAVENMKGVAGDPARALIGLRIYIKEVVRSQIFLKNLKAQIKNDSIKFTDNDGGAFFAQYFYEN